VETRVRTPLGLPGQTQVRGPFRLRRADLACSRHAFVPRRFSHYQYDRASHFERRLGCSRPDDFVRPRLQVAREIGNALPPLMARAFAMQIGRALGSAVAEMPFSEELVVGAITVLGKAGSATCGWRFAEASRL
jgi:site-specific DNA-cytosine methylase